MKTCSNCIYWRHLGACSGRRVVLYNSRQVDVPPGDEGQCRSRPPIEDFRWPLTSAGDWCGQHLSQPFVTPAGVRTPEAAPELTLDAGAPGPASPVATAPEATSEPEHRRPRKLRGQG